MYAFGLARRQDLQATLSLQKCPFASRLAVRLCGTNKPPTELVARSTKLLVFVRKAGVKFPSCGGVAVVLRSRNPKP